jgi:hypothetical protein
MIMLISQEIARVEVGILLFFLKTKGVLPKAEGAYKLVRKRCKLYLTASSQQENKPACTTCMCSLSIYYR